MDVVTVSVVDAACLFRGCSKVLRSLCPARQQWEHGEWERGAAQLIFISVAGSEELTSQHCVNYSLL